jgi:hypothetical protein
VLDWPGLSGLAWPSKYLKRVCVCGGGGVRGGGLGGGRVWWHSKEDAMAGSQTRALLSRLGPGVVGWVEAPMALSGCVDASTKTMLRQVRLAATPAHFFQYA